MTKTLIAHIELTESQWEHLRAAVLLDRPLTNALAPRLIGLTKGGWRGVQNKPGLRDTMLACGWLMPRGKDRKAGYAPTPALREFLERRGWQRH